jgi:hypothetical protein
MNQKYRCAICKPPPLKILLSSLLSQQAAHDQPGLSIEPFGITQLRCGC